MHVKRTEPWLEMKNDFPKIYGFPKSNEERVKRGKGVEEEVEKVEGEGQGQGE
jgi:hypothetical protein